MEEKLQESLWQDPKSIKLLFQGRSFREQAAHYATLIAHNETTIKQTAYEMATMIIYFRCLI